MRTLLLVRHAHALTNEHDRISSTPPGEGLSARGREQADALGIALAREPIALGVSTRLLRTRETLERALGARDVPRLVLPELDEIRFGAFEGGPLALYRDWAWGNGPEAPCPGGGESRADAARRIARALAALLARPEDVVLAVSHSLPIRYVLDAAAGDVPASRVAPVPHATPNLLGASAAERAAATLHAWASEPRFADATG